MTRTPETYEITDEEHAEHVRLCKEDWDKWNGVFPDVCEDELFDDFVKPGVSGSGLTMEDIQRIQDEMARGGFTGNLNRASPAAFPPMGVPVMPDGFALKDILSDPASGDFVVRTESVTGDRRDNILSKHEVAASLGIPSDKVREVSKALGLAWKEYYANQNAQVRFPTKDPGMGTAMDRAFNEYQYQQRQRSLTSTSTIMGALSGKLPWT